MTAPEPTPTAEHTDAVALDLDAIEAEFLRECGVCDAGLPMQCSCAQCDFRPTMLALVAEVRRLTVEAATQREWFEAADAAADRRLDQSIAWMERAEAAEAEVRRLTESRATVAANLSASLMLADAEVVTLRAKVAAVEAHPVVLELAEERTRQTAKHGDQSHLPDGTGAALWLSMDDDYIRRHGIRRDNLAAWAKARTDEASQASGDGSITFEHILTEEWAEAIAESDPDALRAELVQVAAVAVQWIEAIDLRAALATTGEGE